MKPRTESATILACLAFLAAGAGGCALDSAGTGGNDVDSAIPFRDTGEAETAVEIDAGEDATAVDAPVDSSADPDTAPSVDAVDAPPLACAPDELSFEKHCYSVDLVPHTFIDARAACAAAAGSHLVTLNSYAENTFVASTTIGLEAWIGLVRDPVSNPKLRTSFKWITGEPNVVDAWSGPEPSASGQCARHTSAGWDDADCTTSYAAICERE